MSERRGDAAGSGARLLAGAGAAVGLAFGLLARLRRGRPIHARGVVLTARLRRDGTGRSGVPWVDGAGDDDVLVRLSRSVGLPGGWPDVHGLAVRAERAGWDLLLSTTFTAPGLRHVLRPGLRPDRGTYGSLVPFRGPHGPVLLAAQPPPGRRLPADPAALGEDLTLEPATLTLAWSDLRRAWQPFGTLEVGTRVDLAAGHADGPDLPVRFDPRRSPPGLETYRWVALLRGPAYAAARRHHPADPAGAARRVPTPRSTS